MILLHHGSNVAIDSVDLSKSKNGKDFGKGFYLNPDYGQALKWARTRVDFYNSGKAIVTSFLFDIDKAKQDGLNIKIFDSYSTEWAKFVVSNRKNSAQTLIHDYDVVIGPIADDSVGNQIRRYMQDYISIEELITEIKFYGSKAIQYYFANEKALQYLKLKK
ncbi:MAG: DUF3990 domain-containing protein [Muribaculaceae bacterium]|nr:DUF3990 domain-containing protein [Muribaculaceae bacterium]